MQITQLKSYRISDGSIGSYDLLKYFIGGVYHAENLPSIPTISKYRLRIYEHKNRRMWFPITFGNFLSFAIHYKAMK